MRVNVYAEEMTDRIEIISKEIDGHVFTGLRFYLELPVSVPVVQDGEHMGYMEHKGPFLHRPGDDDSSAVTFWGKRDLREVLRKALAALDGHYGKAQYLAAVDLVKHLYRQRAFSERTFGPGPRTAGVIDHIRKELIEIEAHPSDLTEWIDVVLLALDGAWRAGHTPEQIACELAEKQRRNEARTWPDWRTAPEGKAIEHVQKAQP